MIATGSSFRGDRLGAVRAAAAHPLPGVQAGHNLAADHGRVMKTTASNVLKATGQNCRVP